VLAAHVAVEFVGVAHAMPHMPQLATLVARSTSQPSLTLMLQSAMPALHMNEHEPPMHAAVPPGPLGQTLPHVPQFERSDPVATSQPFAAVRSQSSYPAAHMMPHVPPAQVAVPIGPDVHAVAHVPQWPTSVSVFVQTIVAPSMQISFGGSHGS